MTSKPDIQYKRVYRCSMCGATIREEDDECPNCGSSLYTVDGVDRDYFVCTKENVMRLLYSIPNGTSKGTEPVFGDGIGQGIGENVANHHIPVGVRVGEDLSEVLGDLISKGDKVIMYEGYNADTLLIHPAEYEDVTGIGNFYFYRQRKQLPARAVVIGSLYGMDVIITKHITTHYLMMFDSTSITTEDGEINGDAGVILYIMYGRGYAK